MDLETKEIEAEEKDEEENTIKEAEQIAVSYKYTIHCSDRTTQKPVINRESENIIKDLIKNLQEDLNIILDKLCDPFPCEKMTPKLWRQYQTANKCWICEKKLHESRYNKLRVFDPESKKYLGASHRKYYRKKPMIQYKLDDEQKKVYGSCKKCGLFIKQAEYRYYQEICLEKHLLQSEPRCPVFRCNKDIETFLSSTSDPMEISPQILAPSSQKDHSSNNQDPPLFESGANTGSVQTSQSKNITYEINTSLKRPNPLASDNLQSTKKVKKSDEKKNSNVAKKLIEELSTETFQISEVSKKVLAIFMIYILQFVKSKNKVSM
ncbi:4061_t:CDS:2 [Acaulospora morrowiae]|uniref:4061_t:CDS:1 n=1 Tax=Acaulospora morrowiae TaxID=94023 RepID=A0A9N8ZDY7_9GLOM|nr:4061_t:CDS:2 [Acaulospora morrowiae]